MKVKILTDTHEHRGEPVPKGGVIEVDEQQAAWLIREKIAEAEEE